MKASDQSIEHYDVVVIGGGLAGSSTALMVTRAAPSARVLIVEHRRAFDRKVGEATVEIGAHFLAETLGLQDVLEREHVPKHGFEFWFHRDGSERLDEMSEVGSLVTPAIPSFLVDRKSLDEEVLGRAEASGARVARPARVLDARPGLADGEVVYEQAGERRTVRARWIVDASGRRRWLGQKLGLLQESDELPTTAMWARWKGVADLDDPRTLAPAPGAVRERGRCTNHFMGRGHWTWLIALPNGETSIGVVFDRRHFTPPPAGRLEETYLSFVRAAPGLRELVADAAPIPGDVRSYRDLPYTTKSYAGDGYALVGDAATFLDPFYSPGIDHLAMSVSATAGLIAGDLGGEWSDAELRKRIRLHDERFTRSARRWMRALYVDKYEIFGDAELTATSFFVETGLYYLGVVGPALRQEEGLELPTLGIEKWQASAAYGLMRFFRWRMKRLARKRLARGTYGRRNRGWRELGPTFGSGERVPSKAMLRGLRLWLQQEWAELLPTRRARSFTAGAGSVPALSTGEER